MPHLSRTKNISTKSERQKKCIYKSINRKPCTLFQELQIQVEEYMALRYTEILDNAARLSGSHVT